MLFDIARSTNTSNSLSPSPPRSMLSPCPWRKGHTLRSHTSRDSRLSKRSTRLLNWLRWVLRMRGGMAGVRRLPLPKFGIDMNPEKRGLWLTTSAGFVPFWRASPILARMPPTRENPSTSLVARAKLQSYSPRDMAAVTSRRFRLAFLTDTVRPSRQCSMLAFTWLCYSGLLEMKASSNWPPMQMVSRLLRAACPDLIFEAQRRSHSGRQNSTATTKLASVPSKKRRG
jgi:hypothetical protein